MEWWAWFIITGLFLLAIALAVGLSILIVRGGKKRHRVRKIGARRRRR
jgi:Ni/Fe-hydrogenase subunit HybB-like protein